MASTPWIISYLTLRKTVGLLGVSLVPVLVIGSFIIDHLINGQPATILTSISAYYYSSMRNELEGKLKRNRIYRICGIAMAVAVTGIPLDGINPIYDKIGFLHPTLILELLAQ
jgi:hypothetical protein